jgi:hypothetical protein
MVDVQSIRRLESGVVVPSSARHPALLSIQVAISSIRSSLLLVGVQSTAMLGVEELVPAYVSPCRALLALPHRRASHHIIDSPLDGPLHSGVSGNHRGNEVQDLVPRAAHNVPEALVDEGSHGTLPVGAERVRDDTLAGSAAALIGVAPRANVPSVCGQRAALAKIVAVCVVRGVRAVLRGMRGSAWSGEGECDCGRGARTYVALTFALGSEPPPAIVRYVVGGWGAFGGCGIATRKLLLLAASLSLGLGVLMTFNPLAL